MVTSYHPPRVQMRTEASFQVDGMAMRGIISDIGEKGVFLETMSPPDPGAAVVIRFMVDGQQFIADGKVVYSMPHMGAGIEFTLMSDEHRTLLRGFLAVNTLQTVGS